MALRIDEEIAGVHVGMEEAVAQRMAQEGLDQRVGEPVEIVSCGAQALDIRHLDAVDPFHGDDVATGSLPIHRRDPEAGVLLGVLGDFGKGRRLEPQIHLDLGRLLERLRHLDRAQAPARRHEALLQAGDQVHGLDVVSEALAHAGTDDLHRHLARSRRRRNLGGVHLSDRGGRDRLLETRIEFVERPAERAFDQGLGRRRRKEGHAVLQLRQIVGEIDADHVRARRQELSDLDIGWPEPLDGFCEPVGARLLLGAPIGKDADEGFGKAHHRREAFGGERQHDALAHHYPADPDKAEICAESTHLGLRPFEGEASWARIMEIGVMRQSFQPECSAAMPPV